METGNGYDIAIVGGGLAGLAASIELAAAGHSVVVFEKEKYPFHKVCGEYISLESWNYLQKLGLPLQKMDLPIIQSLLLTAPNGKAFTTKLPLGGFGISRYNLDERLASIAKQNGVHLFEETKVDEIKFDGCFQISFQQKAGAPKMIRSKICCASAGKRSNLDVKWNREFLQAHDRKLDNYIAVKYHIQSEWPADVIGLHNFENGYCGIAKIEDEKFCLCYMTKANDLKRSGNSISQLEKNILYKNPHLEKIFTTSKIMNGFPITISQVNFNKKTQIEDHVLMLGDSAGMITPLCGNGMSIALHTAKIAADWIGRFLGNEITRDAMEKTYIAEWHRHFAGRLRAGRTIQRFFGSRVLSNVFVQTFKTLPFLAAPVVKMTHGKPF